MHISLSRNYLYLYQTSIRGTFTSVIWGQDGSSFGSFNDYLWTGLISWITLDIEENYRFRRGGRGQTVRNALGITRRAQSKQQALTT